MILLGNQIWSNGCPVGNNLFSYEHYSHANKSQSWATTLRTMVAECANGSENDLSIPATTFQVWGRCSLQVSISMFQWEHNRQGLKVVDVVVDPHVAYHLRPHQREGVVFLYQCVMGMKDFTGQGAILA